MEVEIRTYLDELYDELASSVPLSDCAGIITEGPFKDNMRLMCEEVSRRIFGIPLITFEDEKPGTPLAEHFNEIGAKLKDIEAERQKECQAAEIPEEKN